MSRETHIKRIIDRVKEMNQAHVLRFIDELDENEKAVFIKQLDDIDFELIEHFRSLLKKGRSQKAHAGELKPPDVIPVPKTKTQINEAEEAAKTGEHLIRQGKIAAFLVAGGQGTRLGYNGPKGCFPIGPVTGKTLFEMHAEKIRAAAEYYGVSIPWLIMTSQANDAQTREYFMENNYLGLPEEDVLFFSQDMVPALDENGKLILDEPGHVFTNPNGHGGSLLALVKSGALEAVEKRGIEMLSYFQVDNVMIKIIDPIFIGYHAQAGAQMSSKMVKKRNKHEKVGVFGIVDGKLTVVEYSDLTEEQMGALDENGQLLYGAGSVAIHMINTSFVKAEVEQGFKLPWHIAHKKIPMIDEKGCAVQPESPNAYKFETFVFEALMDTAKSVIMEVSRQEEFSPVKNAEGEDSPDTARHDMTEYYAKWLEAAGAFVPRDESGNVKGKIEISPLYADTPEAFLEKAPAKIIWTPSCYFGPSK